MKTTKELITEAIVGIAMAMGVIYALLRHWPNIGAFLVAVLGVVVATWAICFAISMLFGQPSATDNTGAPCNSGTSEFDRSR